MKYKNTVPVAAAAVLLIVTVLVSSLSNQSSPSVPTAKSNTATASEPVTEADKTLDDMRGIWITYMELNMANEADKSEGAFRKKFETIAENCASFGFNTLVVQVRPFCDALYESDLFPPSHILSGTQGKSAGYDALKIMCEICKSKGLKIHAWINPYRVMYHETPEVLADNNPYVKDPSLGITTESSVILDPSSITVRQLITDGVREIVENYDVDGIQFDDYFYPTDIANNDSEQYQAYANAAKSGSVMNLEAWRKFNVSLLISETYLCIHRTRNDVVFGISPQGNLSNNEGLSADVVNWCGKKGFIDYICPQLYFSFDNPRLGFEEALEDWTALEFADNVRMYAGLAGYKAGSDADEGTWLDNSDILLNEYNALKKSNKVSGFMLYSYASLTNADAQDEIENLRKGLN